ncbi:hypothetical protein KSP40_PGU018303 [Platanthera guangdongensis]|uniref:Uncharacterized protein n=1 Tax=Platanthera guangdongensis TaxID=2320717 RepID=A0ABR2N428_9ASPA
MGQREVGSPRRRGKRGEGDEIQGEEEDEAFRQEDTLRGEEAERGEAAEDEGLVREENHSVDGGLARWLFMQYSLAIVSLKLSCLNLKSSIVFSFQIDILKMEHAATSFYLSSHYYMFEFEILCVN